MEFAKRIVLALLQSIATLFLGDLPPAVLKLAIVELWERFAFYGMRSYLILYMTNYMFLPYGTKEAMLISGVVYGLFAGCVYLTPILGGYLAARFLGYRKSIYIGGALMAIGYLLMAVPTLPCFIAALSIVAIGNGFFKPNISSLLGEVLPKNDPRQQSIFTIFYMGINVGAFLSPHICGRLAEKVAWHWGFIAAGIGMIISLVLFTYAKRSLGNLGIAPIIVRAAKEAKRVLLSIADRHRVYAISLITFFTIFFWLAFEQAGSSLAKVAEQHIERNFTIFGHRFTLEASQFASFNPLFVIIFAIPFSKLWDRLAAKGKNPSIPAKMTLGLFSIPLAFSLLYAAALQAHSVGKASMLWLIGAYLIMTFGELCLSPIGLAMVSQYAPTGYTSTLMGVWFLAIFVAQLSGGIFAGFFEFLPLTAFFLIPISIAGVAGIILWICVPTLKRWMNEHAS